VIIGMSSEAYPLSEDSIVTSDVAKAVSWGLKLGCDLGCGGGYIAERMLDNVETIMLVDVNINAVKYARKRLEALGLGARIDAVCSDSLPSVRPEALDVVSSNPPYLPVSDGDLKWSGGRGGIEVASKFARDSIVALKKGGIMVITLSSLSDVKGFRCLTAELGFKKVYVVKVPVGLMETLITFVFVKKCKCCAEEGGNVPSP